MGLNTILDHLCHGQTGREKPKTLWRGVCRCKSVRFQLRLGSEYHGHHLSEPGLVWQGYLSPFHVIRLPLKNG